MAVLDKVCFPLVFIGIHVFAEEQEETYESETLINGCQRSQVDGSVFESNTNKCHDGKDRNGKDYAYDSVSPKGQHIIDYESK